MCDRDRNSSPIEDVFQDVGVWRPDNIPPPVEVLEEIGVWQDNDRISVAGNWEQDEEQQVVEDDDPNSLRNLLATLETERPIDAFKRSGEFKNVDDPDKFYDEALKQWLESDEFLAHDECRLPYDFYDKTVRIRFPKFSSGHRAKDFEEFISKYVGTNKVRALGMLPLPNEWQMTFFDTEDYEKLLRQKKAKIGSRNVWITPISSHEVRGTVHWLPKSISDAEVAGAFLNEGVVNFVETLDSKEIVELKRYPKGVRYFSIYLNHKKTPQDLPKIITIKELEGYVVIPGRPPTCFHCRKEGHSKKECPIFLMMKNFHLNIAPVLVKMGSGGGDQSESNTSFLCQGDQINQIQSLATTGQGDKSDPTQSNLDPLGAMDQGDPTQSNRLTMDQGYQSDLAQSSCGTMDQGDQSDPAQCNLGLIGQGNQYDLTQSHLGAMDQGDPTQSNRGNMDQGYQSDLAQSNRGTMDQGDQSDPAQSNLGHIGQGDQCYLTQSHLGAMDQGDPTQSNRGNTDQGDQSGPSESHLDAMGQGDHSDPAISHLGAVAQGDPTQSNFSTIVQGDSTQGNLGTMIQGNQSDPTQFNLGTTDQGDQSGPSKCHLDEMGEGDQNDPAQSNLGGQGYRDDIRDVDVTKEGEPIVLGKKSPGVTESVAEITCAEQVIEEKSMEAFTSKKFKDIVADLQKLENELQQSLDETKDSLNEKFQRATGILNDLLTLK